LAYISDPPPLSRDRGGVADADLVPVGHRDDVRGFPQPLAAERLLSLPNINWQACCHVADGALPDGQPIARAEIEMLLGAPVLRLPGPPVPDQTINLADGGAVSTLELGEAREVALAAMTRPDGEAPLIAAAEEIEQDQWILNRFEREQPVYRFTFSDAEGTVLYVSGQSGKIVLRTTASERFWNWFGAIPHWLYFKDLRTDRWLWMQTVVWTSIIGSFLTLFGLYLGIAQWRHGKNGQLSPYRGMFYWHHITGLVFGVVTLAFVASGLVSMHPWGFLDSRDVAGERGRLEGSPPRWAAVRASADALRATRSMLYTCRCRALAAIFTGLPPKRMAALRGWTPRAIRLPSATKS
jgi:hypothetical protein